MLKLPSVYQPPIFGDEVILRSIDWLENLPWRQDNGAQSQNDHYEICLQMRDFKPDEISVKTSDGTIIVEAKHDERRDDYGLTSRHFVRKYRLPDGCKLENVKSRLTPEGMLIITAPRQRVPKQDTIIPVSHESVKTKSKL